MGVISVGDEVTVHGEGPYEVTYVTDDGRLKLTVGGRRGFASLVVLAEWCVRVEEPWQPEPRSMWRGTYGDVFLASHAGAMHRAGSATVYDAADVDRAHSPLVELVPRPDVDLDRLCKAYLEGYVGNDNRQVSAARKAGMRAVLEELGLL